MAINVTNVPVETIIYPGGSKASDAIRHRHGPVRISSLQSVTNEGVSSRERRVAEMWFAAFRADVTSDALTHLTSGHVMRSITPHRKSNGRRCRNQRRGAGMHGRGLEAHQMASSFSDCISNDDEIVIIVSIRISILVVSAQRCGSI